MSIDEMNLDQLREEHARLCRVIYGTGGHTAEDYDRLNAVANRLAEADEVADERANRMWS